MAELVWVKKYFRLIVMIATDHKVFWIWEMTVSSCPLIAVSLTVSDWRVHTAPSGSQYLKGEAILILPLQKRELGGLVVLCCRSWAVSLQNCFPFLLLQKWSHCKVNTSRTVQTLRLTAADIKTDGCKLTCVSQRHCCKVCSFATVSDTEEP